ncbi:hypothetical protein JCM10213v2_001924 [Rhodosporidiobolus nylandii]
MSISDPSLALPPTSTSSASPRASASAVRFASSSHPTPEHGRSTSEVDRLEWEFVPRTTPSYELGQRYAPPVEPKGAVRRVLQPHPKEELAGLPRPSGANSEEREHERQSDEFGGLEDAGIDANAGEGERKWQPACSVETEDVSLSCGTSKGKGKEVVA